MAPSMIHQMVERQAQAWSTADVEQIVADFAPDCLFVVPGQRLQGREQVRALADSYFANHENVTVTVRQIIADAGAIAVEWTWSDRHKTSGATTLAEDAIVFRLQDGQITYWREYIDTICCKSEPH